MMIVEVRSSFCLFLFFTTILHFPCFFISLLFPSALIVSVNHCVTFEGQPQRSASVLETITQTNCVVVFSSNDVAGTPLPLFKT